MEKDLRLCKACKEIKVRIASGRYPNQKDRRYVDAEGKQWTGSLCPPCVVNRSRERMKAKRAKDKLPA